MLVEGRALKLHPLACTAYNADFDGDQMAVHVPLSAEAQAEARFLMLAANNLLKPSEGRPVTVPTQDMVLGSYYLTLKKREGDIPEEVRTRIDEEIGSGKVFRNPEEALMAYQEGAVGLHVPIRIRMTGQFQGNPITRLVDCTVGRLIFNAPIPQDLGYVDRSNPETCLNLEVDFLVGKKQLGKIIDRCIKVHGTAQTSVVLDNIKAQGFKYSTKGAITVAVCDAVIPPEKKDLLANAEANIDRITRQFKRGLISDKERRDLVIQIWDKTTKDVSDALTSNLDAYNPIFMMADSGARGSINQIRQLAGMRGLIANTSGATIEIPIRANYREGLNILEYFISSRGARKGLADTALRTADSGYLTRRLVDVSQDVIIRQQDCGTHEGIVVSDIKDGNEMIESMTDRLVGRYLADDLYDPNTGELLMDRERMVKDEDAKRIVNAGVQSVKIRSILNCEAKHGVCAAAMEPTWQTETMWQLERPWVSSPLSLSASPVLS